VKPKPYPSEKRQFLAGRRREILTFIRELPENEIRNIALNLPPVKRGFRVGQFVELQERVRRFIVNIDRWSDEEWALFQEIWLSWIQHHPELDKVLVGYDNSADFEGDEPIPANSSLDIACFERLVEASREWKVSRETIERFYIFGYFLPDERIDQVIQLARSEAELKPVRDLEVLKMQVQALDEAVKFTSATIDSVRKEAELTVLRSLEPLKNKVQALGEVVKSTTDQVEIWKTGQNELNPYAKSISQEIDATFRSIRDIEGWRKSFEGRLSQLEVEVQKTRSEVWHQLEKIHSGLEEQAEQIRQVTANLEQAVETLIEQLAELDERVRGRLDVDTTDSEALQVDTLARTINEQSLLAPERLSSDTAGRNLDSPEDAKSVLKDNFRAIGMQSQAAGALAAEVLAAALVGEAIFFRGSMAAIVAEICARTLADRFSYRLQIPIGLLNGCSFGAILEKLLAEAIGSEHLSVLIIDGVNLSAPEVYASRLHRLVAERLFGLDNSSTSLLVLGTVAEGVTTLPLSPVLFELGPMFDLDCIVWRDRWSRSEITQGSISRKNWERWTQVNAGTSTEHSVSDWEELCKRLMEPRTPLWRRTINRALTSLSRFTDSDIPTPLQSLLYGWILPRAIALGRDANEMKELLPAEVLDGDRPDKRIARLFDERSSGVEL